MTQELPEKRPEIVLALIAEKHYLIEGEPHMNAMIMGNGPYPTPILVVRFSDPAKIEEVFGPDFDPGHHWKINERAIKRLHDEKAFLEIDA